MPATLQAIVVMATLLVANAFFLPDCLWDVDSWDLEERNPQPRRFRRFLWDDSDVCDWMCDPDLLPHEVCNICCRRSASTPRPPADKSPVINEFPRISSPNQNPNLQPTSSSSQPPNGVIGQQAVPQPSPVQALPAQVPQNQNWPQPPQQNQNWPQPSQQNQNWPQPPQQNQNWPQPPQQNQNWPQPPQQNQNWPQPPQQNQNWPQPPSQSQNMYNYPLPLNQNWNNQPPNPILAPPVSSPPIGEALNVQVPINLTGLIQATVPSRLTTVIQSQSTNQGSSSNGVSLQTQTPQNAPSSGNVGSNGQSQPLPSPNNVAIPSQPPQNAPANGIVGSNGQSQPLPSPNNVAIPSQPPQNAPANGIVGSNGQSQPLPSPNNVAMPSQPLQNAPANTGVSGMVQSALNVMTPQPFTQPGNGQSSSTQNPLPVQQANQPAQVPRQQFETAGQQTVQPAT